MQPDDNNDNSHLHADQAESKKHLEVTASATENERAASDEAPEIADGAPTTQTTNAALSGAAKAQRSALASLGVSLWLKGEPIEVVAAALPAKNAKYKEPMPDAEVAA